VRERHDSKSGPSNAIRSVTALRRGGPAVVCSVCLVVFTLVPTATDVRPVSLVGPSDDPPTAEEERAQVRAKQGEVTLEVDALEARTAELNAALEELAANVAAQQTKLADAQTRVARADADLVAVSAELDEAETRVAALEASRRQLMVDSFTNPPSETAADVFHAENINDATIKQALLEMQTERQAEVLDQLSAASEDLEVSQENKADAAEVAESERADASAALDRVQAAQAQQQRFADEAEAALESKLAESAQLAAVDRQLSDRIAAEQAELARRLAEAKAAQDAKDAAAREAANNASLVKPAPGGLATVTCPNGAGSITVAGSIGTQVRNLLNAAWASGVGLCGWGYRSSDQQIALRKSHCGTSYYAIYQMPASQCSPPTARPGYSMHEQGLAIDFTCGGSGSISSRSSPCFVWLDNNASSHGLSNLPSEPWHWSTNGS
jgi:LAS superfamily LD-carboxypeptidase LdcB